MKKLSLIIAAVLSAAAVLSSCAEKTDNNAGELVLPALSEEEIMNTIDLGLNIDRKHLVKSLKPSGNANPISPNVFCADPTSVEYNGRLYVYGTNDHQQYEEVGNDGKNSYEKIKSLVVFSTDDMVNWVYHGRIEVGEIAPWIYNFMGAIDNIPRGGGRFNSLLSLFLQQRLRSWRDNLYRPCYRMG